MRSYIKIIMLGAMLLLNLLAQAQDLRNRPELQERLTQAKLLEIQKALELSEEKLSALAPIYKRYDAELNAIHFERRTGRQAAGGMMQANPNTLSADEADKLITAQLENAVKMSSLRNRFYPEFKTVLSPQQVLKLYQSEAQIRRRVMQEFRRRFGNR